MAGAGGAGGFGLAPGARIRAVIRSAIISPFPTPKAITFLTLASTAARTRAGASAAVAATTCVSSAT